MKVALDAGHGTQGSHAHTGAVANGLVEDDIALDLAKRIGHHLRAAGHETVYTRADSRLVALTRRAKLACAAKCDLFISIHLNAGPPSAKGVECFVAQGDHASRRTAELLTGAIAKLGLANRGVKWDSQSQHPRLAVLRGTYQSMPSMLVEAGFVTNAHDASCLSDPHWLDRAAATIASTITGK